MPRDPLATASGVADGIAALLTAGLPLPDCWQAVATSGSGRVAEVAGTVERVLRSGGSVADGLRIAASGTRDGGGLRWLAQLWDVLEGSGAAPGPVLRSVSEALRAERDARAAVEVAAAGPRATVLVLAGMPAALVVLGGSLGAAPLNVLFSTGPGRFCLLTGALLWLGGLLWSRQLVRRAR